MTHDASARSPYRLGERYEADMSEEPVSTLQRPNLDGYPSLRRANHSRPHESQATHPGSTSQSRGRKHHKSKEVDSPWGRPHLTFQIYKLELERSKQGEQDRLDRRQSQTDTPEGIGITLSAKLTAFSQCSLSACARAHPEGRHIPIRSGNTDCRFRLV